MARHDVYPNPDGPGYLLDVQADLLDGLNTRIVVPLFPETNAPQPAARLNPVFQIEGRRVVMTTQFLAAVPAAILKTPVTNLSNHFAQITDALDMAFHGF
ncbi:MAG: CcdB family protein [Rhodospirillales bacterium]|nr:CcdB family protein [Rhodospirillales bacterium]